VRLSDDGGEVTTAGAAFLREVLAIEIAVLSPRRTFCRPCLDWSERRYHLAGAVGAAIARGCFASGWIERMRDSRALVITPRGQRALRDRFGFDLAPARAA
jgi:hypothetical protein